MHFLFRALFNAGSLVANCAKDMRPSNCPTAYVEGAVSRTKKEVCTLALLEIKFFFSDLVLHNEKYLDFAKQLEAKTGLTPAQHAMQLTR